MNLCLVLNLNLIFNFIIRFIINLCYFGTILFFAYWANLYITDLLIFIHFLFYLIFHHINLFNTIYKYFKFEKIILNFYLLCFFIILLLLKILLIFIFFFFLVYIHQSPCHIFSIFIINFILSFFSNSVFFPLWNYMWLYFFIRFFLNFFSFFRNLFIIVFCQ